jgi:membrane protein DedA with SNARE-associated domain
MGNHGADVHSLSLLMTWLWCLLAAWLGAVIGFWFGVALSNNEEIPE